MDEGCLRMDEGCFMDEDLRGVDLFRCDFFLEHRMVSILRLVPGLHETRHFFLSIGWDSFPSGHVFDLLGFLLQSA
jgi:hypothetical protein